MTHQLRILYRAHPVLDSTDAEVVEDPAHEGGRHEFAGVGLGRLAGRLRPPPNVDAPGFHPPVLRSVQVDASEVVPTQRRLDQSAVHGVVVVTQASKDPNLQTRRGRLADGGQNFWAGAFHRGQPWQVEAHLHVAGALFGTGGQDDLGRIVVALGRQVEVHAVLVVQPHELIETRVPEFRSPEGRWSTEAFRLEFPQQFDGGRTFEMQVGLGLGHCPYESREIGGGGIVRNSHGD